MTSTKYRRFSEPSPPSVQLSIYFASFSYLNNITIHILVEPPPPYLWGRHICMVPNEGWLFTQLDVSSRTCFLDADFGSAAYSIIGLKEDRKVTFVMIFRSVNALTLKFRHTRTVMIFSFLLLTPRLFQYHVHCSIYFVASNNDNSSHIQYTFRLFFCLRSFVLLCSTFYNMLKSCAFSFSQIQEK